jgi:hypothetical protein
MFPRTRQKNGIKDGGFVGHGFLELLENAGGQDRMIRRLIDRLANAPVSRLVAVAPKVGHSPTGCAIENGGIGQVDCETPDEGGWERAIRRVQSQRLATRGRPAE